MIDKQPDFNVGQVWESPDKEYAYLLIHHEECGFVIMRLLHLVYNWERVYKLGLVFDDDARYLAVKLNYKCYESLEEWMRKK